MEHKSENLFSFDDKLVIEALQNDVERLRAELTAKEAILGEQAQALSDLRAAYEQSSKVAKIGIWECTLPDEKLYWSDFIFDIYELPRDYPLERCQTLDFYTQSSRAELERRRSSAIRECSGFTMDAEIVTSTGKKRWIRLTASIECKDGIPSRIFGLKQDITEQKQLFDTTLYLAEYDQMTGLVNRSKFHLELSALCDAAAHSSVGGALFLIDLDGFKLINDTEGHLAGDECIKLAATRIREAAMSGDIVARIGGDEFAIIRHGTVNEGSLTQLAQNIIDAMREPIIFNGNRLDLGASIGIARFENDTTVTLFHKADMALYTAKGAGRGRFCLHAASFDELGYNR